jgi:cytochrome c556
MRIGPVILVLWTLVNVLWSARLFTRAGAPAEPAAPADGRTSLRVPAEAREAVLAEMRVMLGSVHGVLEGANRADTAAVRRAAMASGMATAADPALESLLPEEFLHLGMATHAAFDSFARNSQAGPEDVRRRLAGITASCVACHATYRLDAK